MVLLVIKCIKPAAFQSEEEYFNQLVKGINKLGFHEKYADIFANLHDKSEISSVFFKIQGLLFYVPLFIFNKEDADFLNEETSSSVESKDKDSQNLCSKNLMRILTRSDLNIFPGLFKLQKLKEYVFKYEKVTFRDKGTSDLQKNIFLDFIIEYTNKIDEMFSESGCDIVFVEHTIGSESLEINMKSLSGEFENKEYFDIKKVHEKLKDKNIGFAKFIVFLMNKSLVRKIQEQKLENLLFGILKEKFKLIFKKPRLAPLPQLELNKQANEGGDITINVSLNLGSISKKLQKEDFSDMFKEILNENWSGYCQNRGLYELFLTNPIILLKYNLLLYKTEISFFLNFILRKLTSSSSISTNYNVIDFLCQFVELLPQPIFSKIYRILEDTYQNFVTDKSDRVDKEKNKTAVNNLGAMIYYMVSTNEDNTMSILLSKIVAGLFSFVEHGDLKHTEGFSKVFDERFSNIDFYQNLVKNIKSLLIVYSEFSRLDRPEQL
ncbi:hypothetical protein CWI38_0417p0030 [Hamiltosporidium tvaerminnensis]|uniref:Uncharacterized protein n=1 Tax=Hamiltosporidium tvaerminnensis TaxID=1176355 RepID=A0A4Q9LYN0_9MICR|nr:hypothetical protein CWI38_0417p0030 [Hamiltosporidium tvaerminnensis]